MSDGRIDPLSTGWLGHSILPATALKQIEEQLQVLRDYDNYYRETCAEREYAKIILYKYKKYFTKQVELQMEMEND